LFSRASQPAPSKPATERAADIIAMKATTARPVDVVMKGITQAVKLVKFSQCRQLQ